MSRRPRCPRAALISSEALLGTLPGPTRKRTAALAAVREPEAAPLELGDERSERHQQHDERKNLSLLHFDTSFRGPRSESPGAVPWPPDTGRPRGRNRRGGARGLLARPEPRRGGFQTHAARSSRRLRRAAARHRRTRLAPRGSARG